MDEDLTGVKVVFDDWDFSMVIEDEEAFKKFRASKNRLRLHKGIPIDPSVDSSCVAFEANGAEVAKVFEKLDCQVVFSSEEVEKINSGKSCRNLL